MDEKEKDRAEERKLRERDLVALMAAVLLPHEKSPKDAVDRAIQIRDAANKELEVTG